MLSGFELYPRWVPLFLHLGLGQLACWQAFPFDSGAKKDRGTRFSVLAWRKIKRERKNAELLAPFSRGL